jgi:hypothetical protein
MDSTTSSQVQDSSSSDLTVASLRYEAVLKLGEKIASELGFDDRADTLSLWMAHYISELIQNAEAARPEERAAELAKCANAILDIWKHRSEFPVSGRPMGDFEPILRAMESLDPDRDAFRYLGALRHMAAETEATSETDKWLGVAEALDYSARILIRYCLAQAAEDAVDQSREWIALAKEADADKELDIVLIRALGEESDLVKATKISDRVRERIQDQINRLEAFQGMATDVVSDLRAQLEECDLPQNESEPGNLVPGGDN